MSELTESLLLVSLVRPVYRRVNSFTVKGVWRYMDYIYSRKLDTTRVIGFFLAALFLFPSGLHAQSHEQGRLIESYIKANPQALSDPALKTLATEGIAAQSGTEPAKQELPDDQSAGLVTTDSLAFGNTRKSTYQDLFAGKLIFPDSLVASLVTFGHDLFSRKQPSPHEQIGIPGAYVIGPGDEIVIMLWGRLNETHRLAVDRNGSINLPRIGPTSVGGLPFSLMQKNIAERLEAIEGVNAHITLGQLRSIQVYIVGEVRSPGLYTMSALADMTYALFAAGGPTAMGSLRNVELRRGGSLVKRVDFYDLLLHGKTDASLRLLPGDVVFVPIVARMAAVIGNVRRSAIYEIRDKCSLSDLLDLAGGMTPGAWTNRIQVERFVNNRYRTIFDIESDSSAKIPLFDIQDGDLVSIFPLVDRNAGLVVLEGNVKRPGRYALAPGMRVSDLVGGFDDLLAETFLDYAVIERYDPPLFLARILPLNLRSAIEERHSTDDIELCAGDRVIIYHRDFFEPDRSVSVDGSVTTPGKYKLLDNMKIRDLVLQAGGLKENASPYRGELYRRNTEGESVVTERIEFEVAAAMRDDPAHNLNLQKFDRVYVRRRKGWEEEKKITLSGEFVYPGTYVLSEGETLDMAIRKAGGFTENAYLEAALLTRPSVKRLEQERNADYFRLLESDMARTATLLAAQGKSDDLAAIMENQKRLAERLQTTTPVGRVVIDLTREHGYRGFLLEDGDALTVPPNLNTVSILGEVFNPSTFRYEPATPSVKTYLDMSGGLKPTADKKNIYVVGADGRVVTNRMARVMQLNLKPGDAMVAPQKLDFSDRYQTFVRTLSSIEKVLTIAVLGTSTAVNAHILQTR